MTDGSLDAGTRIETGRAGTPGREEEILDAALQVFLRFGYRKTSMDEVARAANFSRQGLYLYFPGKQALFHATIDRVVAQVRTAALSALERDDVALPQRLAEAMSALHGGAAGADGSVVHELLRTAADISGPLLDRLHDDVVARIADLLRTTGIEAQWQDTGLSAADLAEHLYLITSAVAQSGQDSARRHEALHIAARVITRGHPG